MDAHKFAVSQSDLSRARTGFAFICPSPLPTSGGPPAVNLLLSAVHPSSMFKLLHGIDLRDLRHSFCHSAGRRHRLSAASDESA